MKKFALLAFLFLLPAIGFARGSDQKYAEFLKKSLFNKMYSKVTSEASAKFFGEFNKLFSGKPIPAKEAHLAAIAASAAIRCEYCSTAQVMLAQKAGVSDDTIKAAVQIAAETARFSILLYGNEFGLDKLMTTLEKMTTAK